MHIDICCIFAVETRMIIDIKISKVMKATLGQYYYAPHRNNFGVWQWTEVSENGACGTFITNFGSKEEAREFVWVKNHPGRAIHRRVDKSIYYKQVDVLLRVER